MENRNPYLFEPYDSLVTIKIDDEEFQVPENNSLLRAFQFIGMDLLNAGLCWSQTCENCLIAYTDGKNEETRLALACEQTALNGMVITQMPQGILIK